MTKYANMKLIKEVIINDPPTKYVTYSKREIDPKTGKFKKNVIYLTANIFYANVNYWTKNKIVDEIKGYLMPYFKDMPELTKMRLEFVYSRNTENWDIDNKGYFWVKILLDLFKIPSSRQIINARKRNKIIKTLNILQDDTVKYFEGFSADFVKGKHQLIFRIYGIEKIKQEKLF